MAVRIEDAGFEIRDMIAWVYGSGFPKSLNLKGEWQGWGTALKPALEPITVARKPLIGTVAENVLQHGTGAINVDGGRVGTEQRYNSPARNKAGGNSLNMSAVGMPQDANGRMAAGRWPANFIHDGSEEATDLLGASARFFYCAKASAKDRDEGVAGVAGVAGGMSGRRDGSMGSITMRKNTHPTVKPTDLMRYLCRLVTPPSGIVLDPFMGSGSTGKAAMLEGFAFVGIEREAEYIDIAKARIQSAVGLL
jgi:site-specific DNA-methyltransferase (adenine-specific)